MATGKRYYWIKLKESFMSSDTVDFLMSQKDGANYVVLYQMLCLKTINTGGRLSRTIGEMVIPYDVDKIQRDCKWFSADTVRVALNLYKGFGLIYEEMDGTLVLAEHESMVGSETNWAAQKRNQRSELPALSDGGQCPPLCPPASGENVHPEIRDKETRYQSSEIRDKETDTRGKETVCVEQPAGRSTPAPTPSKFNLPLNDGSLYNVPMEDIAEYKELYPAVDVDQELRGMIGWLKSNPKRRKTNTGIKGFITRWLKKTQDEGGAHRAIIPDKNTYDTRPAPEGNPFADVPDFEDES